MGRDEKRLGKSFAFQFHLELSGDDWARWCAAPEHAAAREGAFSASHFHS